MGEERISFLVAGAQKCGTTALFHYLRRHPSLFMPPCKQAHFFDDDKKFLADEPDYSSYHRFFPFIKNKSIQSGEATPIYMYLPESIKRIAQYNPQIKIILILRNPITRAYSNWNMSRNKKIEELSFMQALEMEAERLATKTTSARYFFSYCDRGFYYKQITNIYASFPRENVLVIKHDDFLSDLHSTLLNIFDFLGVPPMNMIHQQQELIHSRSYERAINQTEWDYLLNMYNDDILKLENLLQWDCSNWKIFPTELKNK